MRYVQDVHKMTCSFPVFLSQKQPICEVNHYNLSCLVMSLLPDAFCINLLLTSLWHMLANAT